MRNLSESIRVEFGKLATMYRMQFVHADAFLSFLEKEWQEQPSNLALTSAPVSAEEKPVRPSRESRGAWKKRYSKTTLRVTVALLSKQKAVPFSDVVKHITEHTKNKQRSAITAIHEMCADGIIAKTSISGIKLVTLPSARPE